MTASGEGCAAPGSYDPGPSAVIAQELAGLPSPYGPPFQGTLSAVPYLGKITCGDLAFIFALARGACDHDGTFSMMQSVEGEVFQRPHYDVAVLFSKHFFCRIQLVPVEPLFLCAGNSRGRHVWFSSGK